MHEYKFPLIQQSATVAPCMFTHELNATQHLQLNQPIAPQLAQSLAAQTSPVLSVHDVGIQHSPEHNTAEQVVLVM